MDYQVYGLNGGANSFSNSSSSSSSSTTTSINPNHHNNGDPMQSWWESISKARSRIHSLLPILSTTTTTTVLMSSLSSLADSDRPARSLLDSPDAYSSISASLSSPHSGSGDDPLCQWLYDTFQSSDPDLRLVVLSFVPLVAGLYLSRVHTLSTIEVDSATPSLAGFEAVLLALYAAETRARGGKPVMITLPDLSQPSLYHNPYASTSIAGNHRSGNANKSGSLMANRVVVQSNSVGVVAAPLEPQVAVKSTKRGCIVGVALDCYYKHISQMPDWSKVELCRFAAAWAGADCSCANALDMPQSTRNDFYNDTNNENDNSVTCSLDGNGVVQEEGDDAVVDDAMARLDIQESRVDSDEKVGARIPLPWEILQPVLRVLGHCLLGPLGSQDVKDAAGVAVRRLYARASHDLFPQAILATRSLIQLDNRARASAEAAAIANASSTVTTPSKAKKPEVLLVSK